MGPHEGGLVALDLVKPADGAGDPSVLSERVKNHAYKKTPKIKESVGFKPIFPLKGWMCEPAELFRVEKLRHHPGEGPQTTLL